MMTRIMATFAIIAVTLPKVTAAEPSPDLRLTLPSEFYAVAGSEISVYFDNVVLTESPGQFRFEVACSIGETSKRRWTVTPQAKDVGTHSLTVTVSDSSGRRLGQKSTRLQVVAKDAAKNQSVRILIVGDSLTHATLYPNELARLLSQPGNPNWQMIGTHRPKNAAEEVRHEGYGGWTWQRFVNRYEPNPDGTHRKRSSPFVFLRKDQKPTLDVSRYFEEASDGERPDVVFFMLGINDCFSANPNDLAATDERIDVMLKQAETLLTAFRNAAPEADLAICLTTPPNSREKAFEANYKGRYPRWGWKRIQHRLVERLLAEYESRALKTADQPGRLFVVPTHLNLDPIDGYPENNGVHPNASGYRQIGVSLYSWLKWRKGR